jgi:hypothetical protein
VPFSGLVVNAETMAFVSAKMCFVLLFQKEKRVVLFTATWGTE